MTDDLKRLDEFVNQRENFYRVSERPYLADNQIRTFDSETVTIFTIDTVNESFRWDTEYDVFLATLSVPPEMDYPYFVGDYCNYPLKTFECFTALLDIDVVSLIEDLYNERVNLAEQNEHGYCLGLTPDIVRSVISVCDKYCPHDFVSSVLLKGKVMNALRFESLNNGFRYSLGKCFRLLVDVKNYVLNGDYHDVYSFDLLDKYHFHDLLDLINWDETMTIAQLIANSRLIDFDFITTSTAVKFVEKNRPLFSKYEELSKSGTKREFRIYGDPLDYYLLLMLREVAVQKLWIRRCNHCGRFFVADRNNILYCDRKLKEGSNRTCRDVGARLTHSNKVKEDPHESLRIRIYKRLQMNASRHNDIPEYMKRFEEFKRVSADMKEKYKKGIIPEKEYHDYLVAEDERGSRL